MHTTEGLVSKPCAGSVETVWNRLLETLKTLNVPLFATVDHAANARAAGLFMPETRVAFFGKPAVGTHLMLERPEVALELPLRIVISEVPGEGTMLFMPDILWLAHRYGIDPQLDSLRKTLGFIALVSDKVCGDGDEPGGEKPFLKKGFLSPPDPPSHLPKTVKNLGKAGGLKRGNRSKRFCYSPTANYSSLSCSTFLSSFLVPYVEPNFPFSYSYHATQNILSPRNSLLLFYKLFSKNVSLSQ